jgi:DNA integrity scanning protein DisA with diadenylate cyclase activity
MYKAIRAMKFSQAIRSIPKMNQQTLWDTVAKAITILEKASLGTIFMILEQKIKYSKANRQELKNEKKK